MAGHGPSYEYRIERKEDGKKKKWYRYNLNFPGAHQHIGRFLEDFMPSELTRSAGFCCLEVGFYDDDDDAEDFEDPEKKENDLESPAAETKTTAREGPDGDDAGASEENQRGKLVDEKSCQFYVVYRQVHNANSPTEGAAGAAEPKQVTWAHEFVPKRASQANLQKRAQLKNEIRKRKESDQGLTKQDVLSLGKQFGALRGVWLFHVATGHQVDYLWRKLALALVEGRLPAKRIQVMARDDVIESGDHMMSAHCADFSSQEKVFQLEKEMRAIGVRKPMYFKPVVYSRAGIYKGNPWGIKATLCFSQFDVGSRTSTIHISDSDRLIKQKI